MQFCTGWGQVSSAAQTGACVIEIVLLIEILTCTINFYGIFILFLVFCLFVNDALCQSIMLPIVVVLNLAANKF